MVRMAREHRSWGYDRIVGALDNLGYTMSDQTAGHVLKRHGIPPSPERKKTVTWEECIRFHLDHAGDGLRHQRDVGLDVRAMAVDPLHRRGPGTYCLCVCMRR